MFKILAILAALSTEGNFIEMGGYAVQGGMIQISAPEGTEITFDGEQVRGFGNFYYLALGRDAAPTSVLKVEYPDGDEEEYTINVEQRQYETQRINRVSNAIVQPNPQNKERMNREVINITEARLNADYPCPTNRWLSFIKPADGIVTGWFGSQRVYNGVPAAPHSGVDFAGPIGAPAYAPEDGKVIFTDNFFATGNTMAIDHGCGVVSTFLHLSAFDKKVGDIVRKGEVVARIGKTGLATGPHLHWNVNIGQTRLDGLLLLR